MIIVTILITNILTMVNGSFMIWTLSMDPNWQKYCLRFSSPVCHERPPTKSFTEMSRYQTVTVWLWRPGHEVKLSWYVKCCFPVDPHKKKVGPFAQWRKQSKWGVLCSYPRDSPPPGVRCPGRSGCWSWCAGQHWASHCPHFTAGLHCKVSLSGEECQVLVVWYDLLYSLLLPGHCHGQRLGSDWHFSCPCPGLGYKQTCSEFLLKHLVVGSVSQQSYLWWNLVIIQLATFTKTGQGGTTDQCSINLPHKYLYNVMWINTSTGVLQYFTKITLHWYIIMTMLNKCKNICSSYGGQHFFRH